MGLDVLMLVRAPVPILCYHKVERRRELGVTRLSPRRFARQIASLAREGWRTLSLPEVLAVVRGTRSLGERELAITFDDAYRGLRDHAFPVLEAHGFRATCFVITEFAGALNRWDVAYGGRRFAHLAWRDMRAWQHRGIDFASHTATHPRLTWADELTVARELAHSRAAIERELGVPPLAVAYPFGACGPRERELAQLEGYEAGFTLTDTWRDTAFAVPRLPVYMWSPATPGVGALAPLEFAAAFLANRCAVGTTIWRRIRGQAPTDRRPSAAGTTPVPAAGD